jgi:hypothetical protein
MTTGDEPMLPQPTDDNAPMISGRGTKVIADARGAYLAGNLIALIDQMDNTEWRQFKRTVLSEMFRAIDRWFAVEANNPYEGACQRVRHNPSQETAQALIDLLVDTRAVRHISAPVGRPWDEFIYSPDTHWGILVEVAWTAGAEKKHVANLPLGVILHNICHILRSQGHSSDFCASRDQSIFSMTKQRQLDVAWAILLGKEPPLFEVNA